MGEPWRNWSGSVVFEPGAVHCPQDEAAVAERVRGVHARSGKVRAVGAGHTSNDLLRCQDVLLSTQRLSGVVQVDRRGLRATVRAGTQLQELGRALYEHDLALPNYGDVATQTIGGAIATGTHGTGRRLHNLSHMLVGARLVDGCGRVVVFHENQAEPLRALRIALGSCGILTEVTLRVVPSFDVERREYALRTDAAMEQLDGLAERNRSLDFYWYPRRDDIKLRLVNPAGGNHAPRDARELTHLSGYGHEVIPTHSGIPHRFEECEYALPAERGPACFQAVRARVLQRWRATVGWRLLYRYIAADDTWLSPAYGRDTVTLSLHQNATLPWRGYFDDIEPIFREFGGRPHWAKKHRATSTQLAPLYPRWDDFLRFRNRLDPDGVFLTPYLQSLFGVAA